jgi:hypothetical protein
VIKHICVNMIKFAYEEQGLETKQLHFKIIWLFHYYQNHSDILLFHY